mgnify:CR=1 FL=1
MFTEQGSEFQLVLLLFDLLDCIVRVSSYLELRFEDVEVYECLVMEGLGNVLTVGVGLLYLGSDLIQDYIVWVAGVPIAVDGELVLEWSGGIGLVVAGGVVASALVVTLGSTSTTVVVVSIVTSAPTASATTSMGLVSSHVGCAGARCARTINY